MLFEGECPVLRTKSAVEQLGEYWSLVACSLTAPGAVDDPSLWRSEPNLLLGVCNRQRAVDCQRSERVGEAETASGLTRRIDHAGRAETNEAARTRVGGRRS